MKISYSTLHLLIALLGLAVFASQSAYANCLINMQMEDGREGVISCGSSAGNYAMLYDGTDVTNELPAGLLDTFCGAVCPDGHFNPDAGGGHDGFLGRNDSQRFLLKYPKSYRLARANRLERESLWLTHTGSPFLWSATVNDVFALGE